MARGGEGAEGARGRDLRGAMSRFGFVMTRELVNQNGEKGKRGGGREGLHGKMLKSIAYKVNTRRDLILSVLLDLHIQI